MAVIVVCPGCSTKLSAPESAAGKMIRCPKCGATPTVPEPVVEAAFAPPTPAPRPKPAPPRDEEEERPRSRARREEEEERPRKKRKRYADDDDDDYGPPRRRRKKSGGGGKIALIVLGSLLLLAGVGVGIYYLVGKGGLFTKKAPVPAGWKQYSYPNDGFKAYFPEEPVVLSNNANPLRGGGGGGMNFPGMAEVGQMDSVSTYICGDKFGLTGPNERNSGKVNIVISIAQFRNGVPRSLRDQIGKVTSAKMGGMETRRVKWLGYDAAELIMGGSLHRIVYTDKAMINVEISGAKGGRATPEEENGFFDNFELIK